MGFSFSLLFLLSSATHYPTIVKSEMTSTFLFLSKQNNISIDHKLRHDIPRHSVEKVGDIDGIFLSSSCYISARGLVFHLFAQGFSLLYFVSENTCFCHFQVICSLCDTEQEVSVYTHFS